MKTPKVSIIIPIYNVEKYLRQCLDSVLNQTLRDIEIICVDDGSTDGSADILKRYATGDVRVKVVGQENSGAGAARNSGLMVAQGEFLYFCDPDDWLQRSMLQRMVAAAERDETDVVVCRYEQFDDSSGSSKGTFVFSETLARYVSAGRTCIRPDEIGGELFIMAGYAPWNKLFHRSYIMRNNLKFQEIWRTNDMFFVAMALVNANKIAVVDEVLYTYRVGIPSVTSKDLLADSFCDALLAIRKRMTEDGVFDKNKDAFFLLAMLSLMYNIRSNRDSSVLERIYPKMRMTILELIPEGRLGAGSLITWQMHAVLNAMQKTGECREVVSIIKGFWPRVKNWIYQKWYRLIGMRIR